MKQGYWDNLLICILPLSAVLYYLYYYNYGLQLLDEGYLLDPVMRVTRGEIPYKDFRHIYAPGSFYLFSWLFKIFGTRIGVVRIFWAVLHSFTVAIAYLILRRFVAPIFAFLGVMELVIAPAPWHKSFFVCLPFICFWIYIKYIEQRNDKWLFLAALISLTAFLLRQDSGLYGCVVFVIMVLMLPHNEDKIHKWREIAKFVFLFMLLLTPVIIFFYNHSALADATEEIFLSGFRATNTLSFPYPAFFPLYSINILSTIENKLFYLPFLIYGVSIFYAVIKWKSLKKDYTHIKYVGLLAYGCLVLLEVKNRSDLPHLWQVLPFVFVVIAVLFGRIYEESDRFRWLNMLLFTALIFGVVLVAMQDRSSGSMAIKKGCDTVIELPRARLYLPKKMARELMDTVDFIKANSSKGNYILALPNIPIIYFLADRRNPTFAEVFLLGMTSGKSDQKKIISDIEARQVNLIARNVTETDGDIKNRRFKNHSPILYSYIMTHYHKVAQAGNIVFFKSNNIKLTKCL